MKTQNLLGYNHAEGSKTFRAIDPSSNKELNGEFHVATSFDVDAALILAEKAFAVYRNIDKKRKATFLRNIAEEINNIGDELIERAMAESGLPQARLQGERGRTTGQLTMFANVAEEGSWVEATIDRALPDRQPAPRPDIRKMLIPVGPAVVFGASNFPLAFSVAGGDTASALAAGCPVIVKAHSAHPGTSELVGQAVQQAVRQCNLPEGVFSLLFGRGAQIGVALMKHPLVKAGGFTGSRGAGRQLMDTAAA